MKLAYGCGRDEGRDHTLHFTSLKQGRFNLAQAGLITTSRARSLCVALFFLAVICGYLQWFVRHFRFFKLEDSGIFLYIGQRLAHGDVLYRDISDNKPPLIYWLNELGLWLTNGSPAGVFLLCLGAGILSFIILYYGLKEYVDWPIFIIAGSWSQLAILECSLHPNYTESFALPLATLAGVLLMRELITQERLPVFALAQGATAALLFNLRPNNAGIGVIYALYLLVSLRKGYGVRQLFLFIVAGLTAYGLVLLPLALQGILPDYYYNVFTLARPYAGATKFFTRLRALWYGLDLFAKSPLLYLSVVGLAMVGLLHRTHGYVRALPWLTAWGVAEMLLSSISGNHWNHYYLLWIPPLVLILTLSASVLLGKANLSIVSGMLAVTLTGVVLNDAAIRGYADLSYPRAEDPAIALAASYAKPGDEVSTWGYFDHDIWFDLGHKAGTRWFHEGAFTNRKIYNALVVDFLSDLERNKPRVIVERRSAVPLFAPADPTEPLNDAFVAEHFKEWDDPAIVRRKAKLATEYCQATERAGVVVYLLCR